MALTSAAARVAVTTRAYAVTYAERNIAGAHGVHILVGEVVTAPGTAYFDGDVEYQEWMWHAAPPAEKWTLFAADEHLHRLGWRRITTWNYEDDLAGDTGWTTAIERLTDGA